MKKLIFTFATLALLSGNAQALRIEASDVKNNHMRNCMTRGGVKEICLCSYERSLKIMTLEELATVNSQLAGGTNPNGSLLTKLTSAAKDCAKTTAVPDDSVGLPPPPPPPPSPDAVPDPIKSTIDDKNYMSGLEPTPEPPELKPVVEAVDAKEEPKKVVTVPVEKKAVAVKKLVSKRPIGYFGQYDQLFINAAAKGDISAMQALSQKIYDVEGSDAEGNTALHLASKNGKMTAVRFLIGKGAVVNSTNLSEQTPLHLASYSGRPDIVEILLKAGTNVNVTYGDGYTPLVLAVMRQDERSVDMLLKQKAKLSKSLPGGNSELHLAASGSNPAIIQELVDFGAKINKKNAAGYTPLMVAAYSGNAAGAQTLLSLGAEASLTDPVGRTALTLAHASGKKDVINLLLSYR